MTDIIKRVDKTSVNFEDLFTYTIDISFSGITGDINNAKVIDFIPDYINYVLPRVNDPIKNIIETKVDGGTLITIDFGAITDLGIAISIDIICNFILGTDNNTSHENNIELYINEVLTNSSTSEVVTLEVNEDFFIQKDLVVPKTDSAPGGRLIYSLILENNLKSNGGNGDLGAKAYNISIIDVLPEGISLDTDFDVIGNDISQGIYKDTRYDNQVGLVNGNTITFNIDNYYGTKYRIIFVAKVNEDVQIGTSIINTANLSIQDTSRNDSSHTLVIGQKIYGGSISKSGPNYAQVNNYVTYSLNVKNYANQDLINFTISDSIPSEIRPYKITTGSFMIDTIKVPINQSYDIVYEINNSGEYTTLGTYNTETSQEVDLPQINQPDNITNIRWNINNLPVGAVPKNNIRIDGIIETSNEENEIVNTGQITWNEESEVKEINTQQSINISDISELRVSKKIKGNSGTVVPGDIIRYSITFDGYKSQINNPVVSDLLSEKIEYVGNEKYIFYDYFDKSSITSDNQNFFDIVSVNKEIIDNFNNTNRELVRYTLDNFSLRQNGVFTIEFDTKVKIGEVGTLNNDAILGTVGDKGIVSSGYSQYNDIDDRDGDLITNEVLALSNNKSSNIAYFQSILSNKKVKGALDTDYTEEPLVGKTYQGGSINYKIEIKNSGNLDFTQLEIVDILPHINDTGVILTSSDRLSEFNIYNVEAIEAIIIDENNENITQANLKIEYSKSYNPVRFSKDNFGNDLIGVDNDWSEIIPNPITDTKSIKITTIDTPLKPNQTLIINMKCLAPFDVDEGLVAWNSFAVKSSYKNEEGIVNQLIPVEPEKVGIEVETVNKASISGRAFLDKNKDGNINEQDYGLNSIIVKLYDENKNLIQQTLTINNMEGSEGYYLFNNLDTGKYNIQFIRPNNLYFSSYNYFTDNKADPITGVTQDINITGVENIENIDVGFIEELDVVLMLLDILHYDIFTMDCDLIEKIISSIYKIKKDLITVLNLLSEKIKESLSSNHIKDMAYKAQLERFIYSIENILTKLSSIQLPNNYCNTNVILNILYILSEYIIYLIKNVEYNKGIEVYYNKDYCNEMYYQSLVYRFVNSIRELDYITNDLQYIMSIMYIDINSYYKPYVPVYTPKK